MQNKMLRRSRSLMSSVQTAVVPNRKFAIGLKLSLLMLLVTVIHVSVLPISGRAQTPFYQGQTIKIIVAATPGGTGDFRVRALAPFLHKHIPGNPAVVLEFMDGSGGRRAANHMYANARPDGFTLGSLRAV